MIKGDGEGINLVPFAMFEKAWTLWNLSLSNIWKSQTHELTKLHLEHLANPGKSVIRALKFNICFHENWDNS